MHSLDLSSVVITPSLMGHGLAFLFSCFVFDLFGIGAGAEAAGDTQTKW